jgi:hypothetical protein
MKRLTGIILCIWIAAGVSAVDYPFTSFNSTSIYTGGRDSQPVAAANRQLSGSMSAISSANFAALNSEGGACYQPAASAPRKGRPGGDDSGGGSGAIGEYDFHSPVGDTPFWLFALLGGIYAFFRMRRAGRNHESCKK